MYYYVVSLCVSVTNEIIPVEDMYGDVTKEVIIDKELKCKVIDLRRDQDTRPQPAQETTPTRPGPSQGPRRTL